MSLSLALGSLYTSAEKRDGIDGRQPTFSLVHEKFYERPTPMQDLASRMNYSRALPRMQFTTPEKLAEIDGREIGILLFMRGKVTTEMDLSKLPVDETTNRRLLEIDPDWEHDQHTPVIIKSDWDLIAISLTRFAQTMGASILRSLDRMDYSGEFYRIDTYLHDGKTLRDFDQMRVGRTMRGQVPEQPRYIGHIITTKLLNLFGEFGIIRRTQFPDIAKTLLDTATLKGIAEITAGLGLDRDIRPALPILDSQDFNESLARREAVIQQVAPTLAQYINSQVTNAPYSVNAFRNCAEWMRQLQVAIQGGPPLPSEPLLPLREN